MLHSRDLGDTLGAVERVRKYTTQLASKQRFLSARLLALFDNDTWLNNAQHANDMARYLAECAGRYRDFVERPRRLKAPVFGSLTSAGTYTKTRTVGLCGSLVSEPRPGIDPGTSILPRWRSTTELSGQRGMSLPMNFAEVKSRRQNRDEHGERHDFLQIERVSARANRRTKTSSSLF